MRKINKILIIISIFCLIILSAPVYAVISITASGSWSETINEIDLISGAGSDLSSTYESISSAVSISVSGTAGGGDNWRVDVRKSDTTWHNDFVLYNQRTSDGTGGSVSGGLAYQVITDIDQSFFSGSDDVSGINVQLKLSGMSVNVAPNNYSTTVYYTVVDI